MIVNCDIAHICFLTGSRWHQMADSDTNQQRSVRGVHGIVPEPTTVHVLHVSCHRVQQIWDQLPSIFRRCGKYCYNSLCFMCQPDFMVGASNLSVWALTYRMLPVDSELRWLICVQFCCLLLTKHPVNFSPQVDISSPVICHILAGDMPYPQVWGLKYIIHF
jgi:hypothetical protein